MKGAPSCGSRLLLFQPCFSAAPHSREGWQEYVYADYGFAVSFPEAPKTESGRFQLPDGSVVPATIYSVTEPDGDYRVTIADFTNRPEGENSILNSAETTLKRNAHGESGNGRPGCRRCSAANSVSRAAMAAISALRCLCINTGCIRSRAPRSPPPRRPDRVTRYGSSSRCASRATPQAFSGLNLLLGALRQL